MATTGRPFHIASATVRPKPSAMLFCTTTSARRCSALTITAFSSASSIGSSARCTRRRAARGQLAPGRLDLGEDLGALGIVGDRGDVRTREHEVRVLVGAHVLDEAGEHAERVLEAVPARDLDDQRRVEPQRVSSIIRAARSTRPVLPSSRSNTARDGW